MHAQLISYILNLAPTAPIVPMFSSALNSYVLHVSLALFVLSCSLLLPIKVNVFFWFGLVPSKRLKSGTKVITHVLKKFSKSSFVYDVLSVCNVMGSATFPVFLAYLRFQSPSHLFKKKNRRKTESCNQQLELTGAVFLSWRLKRLLQKRTAKHT